MTLRRLTRLVLTARNERIRVKICCIQNIHEAQLAIHRGASALGLVAAMPSGPGIIPEPQIRRIAAVIPPYVTSVLLTSHQTVPAIVAQHHRCRTNAIQIVDHLIDGTYDELRRALPGIDLIQVIHVTSQAAIEKAIDVAPSVDGILLDSGRPHQQRKELGGTGRTHDWEISFLIQKMVDTPIILAGGLTPLNVSEAIQHVTPYAVDVCSGVRTRDRLDESKLSQFMENIERASTSIPE
jgi:phosphoribosylanthranilate isomerase